VAFRAPASGSRRSCESRLVCATSCYQCPRFRVS
jgi:hypothetical protein